MRLTWRRLRRWLGGAIAFALIAAAVLLTAIRIALPFAGDYRAELESRVADYLDTPVSIGRMEVEWHGLGPRLRLVDLRLAGPPPARSPVHFDEAYVDLGFAPWRESELPVRIRSVSLVGLDLEVELDERERLSLLGVEVPVERLIPTGDTPPPFVRRIADWLLGTDRIQLLDTSIDVLHPDGARSTIADIEFRLINEGPRSRASLALDLPAQWGGRAEIMLEASGTRFGDWDGWSGRIWANASDLALRNWSALYPDTPIRIRDGRGDATAWIDFGGGRLQSIALRAGVDDALLTGGPAEAEVGFERVAGRLEWRRLRDDEWQLDIGDLNIRRNGRAWPTAGLSLAPEDAALGRRWHVGADFLRIEDALALARLTPVAEAFDGRLQALAPRGDLRALRAAGSAPDRFELRTRFDEVGWNPSGKLPGASGFDGSLRADAGRVRVALDTTDAVVDAPAVMAGPLPVASLSGSLDVEGTAETFRIRADDLRLRNEDGEVSGRVHAWRDRGGPLQLDIAADFADARIAAVPRYLPVPAIPEPVVQGLERTLQGGRAPWGRLRLKGAASDFPFGDGDGEGVFSVDVAARDARIDFAPGWPALEGVSGRVRIDGPALRVETERAQLLGIGTRQVQVTIPDLGEGRLEASAGADAPVEGLVRLVNESPLAEDLGAFFAGAGGNGRVPFALDLVVPLTDPQAMRVDGRLDFDGADLIQPRFGLDLRDLQGELRFSRLGIEADGLTTRLRGERIRLDARVGDGPGAANTIRARGELPPEALVPGIDAALGGRVDGRSPWRLQLRIPGTGGGPVMLAGTSDLVGTAIDLPAPIGKAGDAARRIAFSLPLEPDVTRHRLRIDYGDRARALVELAAGGDGGVSHARSVLRFGPGGLRLRPGPGLYIGGELERLDLHAWADAMFALSGGGTGAAGFGGADLQVRAVDYAGHAFSDLHLTAERADGAWALAIDSNEARGRVRVPGAGGEPVRVRFDWVDLGLLQPADGGAAATSGVGRLDPAAIPPLDVRITRLKTLDARLNEVVLVTGPTGNGLTIHRLAFTNDTLRLQGQGRWRGGGRARTDLRLDFRGENFGAGLADLGYGGALIEGEGQVTANLEWPGAPWAPTFAGLGGHAELRLEDGVIPEVDPGPARLLGLLSLRSLPQMLSLDLRGLVGSGFAFNEIKGRVDFADGNAYSRGLKVDGPAGLMTIDGRTGLVARDYDQRVRFQPQLSNSLPIIGAIAGGPVTGLAVAVVQGVLRNVGADVEEVTELTYSLTGTWADPKVESVEQEVSEQPVEEEPSTSPAERP